MNYFDEFFEKVKDDVASEKAPTFDVENNSYDSDKKRSAILDNELGTVNQLLEGLEIPDSVRSSLSVNVSTSASLTNRTSPTIDEKVRALWDFWAFIDLIGFHGGSIAFSDCHKEMMGWKLRPSASFRQLILEARGMLKSTLCCVALTLWRVYQNPNIRIFVGSEGLKLSKAFIREIESWLTDDWLKENVWNSRPHFKGPLIPEMDSIGKQRRSIIRDVSNEFGDEFTTDTKKASTSKKVWRAEAIQVVRTRTMREPTITAGSVGQTSTGFHFDELIFDDIHTFDNTRTETKIDSVFSWIYDMESVLDPPYVDVELVSRFHASCLHAFNHVRRWSISGGRITVVGTRYDDEDYYGHVIDNADTLNFEVHQRNIYANGVDNTDGYRWPEKWNEELEKQTIAQFERKHGTSGLKRYYSQYHNKIVDLNTATFNWDLINFVNPASIKYDYETRVATIFNMDGTIKASFRVRLVVDPTSTSSDTSDFCAMAVGGVDGESMYVIDFWMKQERVEKWLDKMYEFIIKYNLYEAVIEMVGGFKVLETTIRLMWQANSTKYRPISIKSYTPPTNTGEGKIQRIESVLSPLISNSLLYLPLYCSRDTQLRKQIIMFGKETVKDDGPDVLSILKVNALPSNVSSDISSSSYKVNDRYGGVEYEESDNLIIVDDWYNRRAS